jgi:hypothetical protein
VLHDSKHKIKRKDNTALSLTKECYSTKLVLFSDRFYCIYFVNRFAVALLCILL